MKKLHKKIIARALAWAIVLRWLQFSGVVSHASGRQFSQVSNMQLENFIKYHRGLSLLPKSASMGGVISKDYKYFDEFKREVFKLEKGYYMVHVGKASISFYKTK